LAHDKRQLFSHLNLYLELLLQQGPFLDHVLLEQFLVSKQQHLKFGLHLLPSSFFLGFPPPAGTRPWHNGSNCRFLFAAAVVPQLPVGDILHDLTISVW
jgi:hypothetical protein